MRRIALILFCCLCALSVVAQDELCTEGTLLFREDFGGNDPDDPSVSTAVVPGMSSTYTNGEGTYMSSGVYTITKKGYKNGIQWHRQDDHTYPDDFTRGYFLEVDGSGGSVPFYSTTIDSLIPNSLLSFSAYVVNVTYAGQIPYLEQNFDYVYPRLKFVLTDPASGATLASKSTGDILADSRYSTSEMWAYARENELSAEWQLVGKNFTVPSNVTSVQMYIYNDVSGGGAGNDFALDDIEVRLCLPAPQIISDSIACADSVYVFDVQFDNDGRLAEPLHYQWFFTTEYNGPDQQTWWMLLGGTVGPNTPNMRIEKVTEEHEGWYMVAVAENGYSGDVTGRVLSPPFHLHMAQCPPPPLNCPDGRLIFHEDFGGNDPDDPMVSTTPVPGMSSNYRQITNLEYKGNNQDMGAGRYLVAKRGYRNSSIPDYSVWHIMDDHTWFGDTTRGYFLEVDGKGDNEAFYQTTLSGLCPGTMLTFMAHIANLTTAGQYSIWRTNRGYAHPRLRFVITDTRTGSVIAEQGTDTISHDWENFAKSWRESADWQQIGMNFTVPEGTDEVLLSIYNNVSGTTDTGNDFALDDIEVRLCAPQVTVTAPDTVCIDTKNILVAELENDTMPSDALHYQWYFSADSTTWTALSDGHERELKLKAKPRHTGWYKVVVSETPSPSCGAVSEPVHMYVINDCPPILCPEGILLLDMDYDGSLTLCDTVIRDVCAGNDLSFIVNLPPDHSDTRLILRLQDDSSGEELAVYDTGDIPSDSLRVGTSFQIPDGVSSLRWTIRNNRPGAAGQPFVIDNTETRLCIEPIAVSSGSPACRKRPHTFGVLYDNYDILLSPEFQWQFSQDSLTWTVLQTDSSRTYTIPVVHRLHEGWYRVLVADSGRTGQAHCRSVSEPFRLQTAYCNTATDRYIDTTACDTLLHFGLMWRGHRWHDVGTVTDTLRDFEDDDSLYVHLVLQSRLCCPEIETFRIDSAVCDSLLPFLWFFRDTMLLYDTPGEQEVAYPHARWYRCTGEICTLALDSFHCERLYLLIHNLYNRQLVCNNVELARIFPDLKPVEFQWFKDSVAIEGANADDYAEQNELHGLYQLRIRMTNGLTVWSNILEILDTPPPLPVTRRIYNWHGVQVSEAAMTRGIYFIRYEQGGKVWTEKLLIP